MRLRSWCFLAVLAGWALSAEAAPPEPTSEPRKYEIPYRLTDTQHVLVRAKLNGKGPFNLILDTGAPAVFITKNVAKKAAVKVDDKGWGTFERFELEGGAVLEKVKTRVEDLVQIDGMNGLGLAGVELHGVIGYNVLARFRIEYDFRAEKLTFQRLDGFDPPAPERIEAKGGDDIQTMGPMIKMLAALSGIKPNFEVIPRGFVGIEVDDNGGKLLVKKVLPDSPAQKAGIRPGDVIESVKAVKVKNGQELLGVLEKLGVGTSVKFTVSRGGKSEDIVVELGKGL